jgi:hypothetical protein
MMLPVTDEGRSPKVAGLNDRRSEGVCPGTPDAAGARRGRQS